MNKTVTANISGIVFHIESEAYDKLQKYLTTIRNYFHDSDGKDEIMADIESRIAELFKESMTHGREVVTMAEVDKVVEIMGEPEQYMDDANDEFSNNYQQGQSHSNFEKIKSKRLFRDEDDKVLGGVCAGMGHYFGIDRIWIRILALIAFFGFGTGIVIYIILWAIIPKAKTTAEKLEMKGEPINVENIGNTIKDEFNSFKKKVDGSSANKYGQQAGDAVSKFFMLLANIITFLFKFLVKFFGVVFVVGASLGLIALISVMIGAPSEIHFNNEHWGGYWSQEFAEIFFNSGNTYTLAFIGIALVTIIPLLSLLYAGLKILFNIPTSNKAVGLSATSLFIIGIILVSFTASSTVALYSSEQQMTEFIELEDLPSDTIRLSSMDEFYSNGYNNSNDIFVENDFIYTDNMSVDVVRSVNDKVNIRLNKSSRGSNRKDAGSKAEHIDFTYEINGSNLSISPYIDFPYEDRYRGQEAEISIELPVGKSIYLENSSIDIIYDIKNVTNTYDGKMIGHTWLMTEIGLQCTDCGWEMKQNNNTEDDDDDAID
ncbi:MAG: PspC domain-containing protein [Flavobacteriales bacterium]|nr:PspC domain-containing protein [Flavobacteriales bacterium]